MRGGWGPAGPPPNSCSQSLLSGWIRSSACRSPRTLRTAAGVLLHRTGVPSPARAPGVCGSSPCSEKSRGWGCWGWGSNPQHPRFRTSPGGAFDLFVPNREKKRSKRPGRRREKEEGEGGKSSHLHNRLMGRGGGERTRDDRSL